MKWVCLLVFLSLPAWSAEELRFEGQGASLIRWDEIDPIEFLDLSQWKREQELKEAAPDWERALRERTLVTEMGRTIECVGDCRTYKGRSFNSLQFKSAVHAGDEVQTGVDSYLWIYLYDGTLVRLSPETSITLRELNIGTRENFVHIRINVGNVLWLTRTEASYQVRQSRETDSLFMPLDFYEANPPPKDPAPAGDLWAQIQPDYPSQRQFERLNKLIEQNNGLTKGKRTYSFIVMPNGTIAGEGVQAEFIVLLGGATYFKHRNASELGLVESAQVPNISFLFRGYENKREFVIRPGQWYEIEPRGRSIETYTPPSLFGIGEYITSTIPTLLVARELMLEKYSSFAFTEMSALTLARQYGYRQWGELNRSGSDLAQRLGFLKEHTRRMETTNLLTAARFRERLQERGDEVPSTSYSARFFNQALVHFQRQREFEHSLTGQEQESLNSTQKTLWKRMHVKRKY